jgi:2-polyprenyl-3-methyl-5-hydroxy-6-metoxy-1,4-benzoquinol methylase
MSALQTISRWCQKTFAPGLRYSQYEYRDALLPVLAGKSSWLDIGCGHQLFAEWMREDQIDAFARCKMSYGIDLDFEGMKKHPDLKYKCMASGYNLPFPAESMDVISANMVMEHVGEPDRLLHEVHRVLRKSGVFIFHTPNRLGYRTRAARLIQNQTLKNFLVKLLDGREEDDVFPTFYLLNDREAIQTAAASNGFQVASIKTVETSPLLSMWGPLAIPELLLIRVLRQPGFEDHRATVIALLQKR